MPKSRWAASSSDRRRRSLLRLPNLGGLFEARARPEPRLLLGREPRAVLQFDQAPIPFEPLDLHLFDQPAKLLARGCHLDEQDLVRVGDVVAPWWRPLTVGHEARYKTVGEAPER